MRHLAIVAILLVGCAEWKVYDPKVLIDGEPALVEEGSFGGQGHIVIKEEDYGKRTVEVVQHGMSNVLGATVKSIFSAAAGVFGGNQEPPSVTINVPGQYQNDGEGNTSVEGDR